MLPNFSVLPPEVNSLRMFAGAGSGPMLAAAAAWDGLAAELHAAAASFGSVTSELAGGPWQGPASVAMANAAAPYAGWLTASAGRAEGAAAQAKSAAAVYEAARAATVHPVMVAANRAQVVSLVASNLFGQNAPAIAATEAHYEQMWAQDVAAMGGYHAGASAVAAQLPPWQQPVQSVLGQVGAATSGLGFPGNSGIGNFGLGNTGNGNFGFGNSGNADVGVGNTGSSNFGFGNSGNANIGIGITGSSRIGIFGLNTGTGNFGLFNSGTGNIGIGNSGTQNIGLFNSGNGTIGIGNPA